MPDPVRRDGELTDESLVAALMDERSRGQRPAKLAVGDDGMFRRGLAIIESGGTFESLRATVPAVERDPSLAAGEWELRET